VKECDKRMSHKSSKLHMIYISYNNVKTPWLEIWAGGWWWWCIAILVVTELYGCFEILRIYSADACIFDQQCTLYIVH